MAPRNPLLLAAALTAGAAVPAQTVWQPAPTTGPSARIGHTMACDEAHGVVVLFGGSDGTTRLGDTWTWNGTTWTLAATSGPSPRAEHAMAYDTQRARIVLFGGEAGSGLQRDTWLWNGTLWAPQLFVTGPTARKEHAMAHDRQRGVTVLFGGMSSTREGDTWEWNGASWTQVATSGPPARSGHAMAYDGGQGRIVMCGGGERSVTQSGFYYTPWWQQIPWSVTYAAQYSDAWSWDGTSWFQLPDVGTGLAHHALVFDAAGGRLLKHGGIEPVTFTPGVPGVYPFTTGSPGSTSPNTTPFADSHLTWDQGLTWLAASTQGPALQNHAIAYDTVRNRAVLFGGHDGSGPTAQTWLWTGAPGTATAYGTGCGSPALTLSPIAAQPPIVGRTAAALVSNTPSSFVFFLVGLTNTNFGAFTLPFSLASFGMPGCELLQSAESGSIPALVQGPTTATCPFAVPNWPGLIDLHLYLQSWAFAPGANPGNTIASNGVDWRIGF